MGRANFLITGGSGTGKTTIATELERRGLSVVHGDRVLAYQGDPQTGAPVTPRPGDAEFISAHHIWDLARLDTMLADHTHDKTFFCGAAQNWPKFIARFDTALVLEANWEDIDRRLDGRPDEWGSTPVERALIRRLHQSRTYSPPGAIPIDAARPLAEVVEDILTRCP